MVAIVLSCSSGCEQLIGFGDYSLRDGGDDFHAIPDEPCDDTERQACSNQAASEPLRCIDGRWKAEPCPPDEVCRSASGRGQGTCEHLHPECAERMPQQEFCLNNVHYRCDRDRIALEVVAACDRDPPACLEDGERARCQCPAGYDGNGVGKDGCSRGGLDAGGKPTSPPMSLRDGAVDTPEDAAPSSDDAGAPEPDAGELCLMSVREVPCGRCGTRPVECSDDGQLLPSECTGEGACVAGTSRACGAAGLQRCASNCQWEECSAQFCEGPAGRACGNCGSQRRTCLNGTWSAWSDCTDEGECIPAELRPCGTNGVQRCASNCQWDLVCSPRVACQGAALRECGWCGTQTRSCRDGVWANWGECSNQGECLPRSTRECLPNGEQSCSDDCRWLPCPASAD